ncbi:MAG: hypothetical protein H7X71_03700, partial [Chitinophagales bacterium]|nr:hypothetical protein [Chitinophagales bacterium]
MEKTTTAQLFAGIAENIFASNSLQKLFSSTEKACISVLKSDTVSVFVFEKESDVFIRRSMKLKGKKKDNTDFPVYLKFTNAINRYEHSSWFLNNHDISSCFENNPFHNGSEVVIPVRMKGVMVAFILATSSDVMEWDSEQEIFCTYITNIFSVVLHTLLQDDEIQKLRNELNTRAELNANRLYAINKSLHKSNQELKQFAYMASHD